MARFLKDKRKAKGQAPGSLIFIGQQAIEHIRIYRTQYSPEYYKEEQITQPQQLRKDLSDKYVTWISIHGLHETEVIAELGQQFEIDPLILEDILNTDERPKFSEDSRHLFIITKSLQFNKETCKVKIEQISIIVGRNYLISFQESETEHFQDVKQRLLNKQSKIRSYSSDYLCYAFIDTLIDNYILNIERFGSVIEEQEKILLIPNKQTVENIYHYKTELAYIRKNIRPIKEVITRFTTSDSPLINERTYKFLRDLESLATQATEAIEIYYTMVSDQQNSYNTNLSNNVNDIMKVLTVLSTIFIPLTFIAGIYGMNFEYIPELKYRYSYFILWGLMLVIALLMLLFFKRKKWF